MAKLTVLGAGGWGMALALSAHGCGHNVTVWTPFEDEAFALRKNRGNERLLPGIALPEDITVTTDLASASGSLLTVIAVPSTAVRQTAHRLREYSECGIIVNVAKGLEQGSLMRLSEVIADELPGAATAVLSGPSHAEEVARNIPTSLVAASLSRPVAEIVQDVLSGEFLRIYTSDDIIGVELGGALKNVIAICAGACDGMGLGDNTKAALITRGLSEMTRLGVCLGAKESTFAGLAGMGDLVVTCTSQHSRNNRFGFKIGMGIAVKQALEEVGTVEGYYAARMAHELSVKYAIEMPIINECYGILYENKPVDGVVRDLMLRPRRTEY